MRPNTQKAAMTIWPMRKVVSMEKENMATVKSTKSTIMIPPSRMSHFSCFSACS